MVVIYMGGILLLCFDVHNIKGSMGEKMLYVQPWPILDCFGDGARQLRHPVIRYVRKERCSCCMVAFRSSSFSEGGGFVGQLGSGETLELALSRSLHRRADGG